MDLKSATVLITGGSTGIGLGFAQRFVSAGSKVIVTGRRESVLDDAKQKVPQLHTIVSDAGSVSDRESLVNEVLTKFPALNVLVNNAGMQRVVALKNESDWPARQQEIAINLEAPVHLASLLSPHFVKQNEAIIINITSGLAFIPCAFAPMYGATKAALHSFTVAMRPHYKGTGIRIVEIAPPPVKTNLPSSQAYGENSDEFCDHAFQRFLKGEQEIGFKLSEEARQEGPEKIEKRFEFMTGRSFQGPTFAEAK